MAISTDKIPAQVGTGINTGIEAARRVLDTKVVPYYNDVVVPYAVPAGQKAAKQVKQVFDERVAPMASSAVDNALVASAPVRREALRRSRLAASALRGDDAAVAMQTAKRRWPMAIAFLLVGGALGAVVAWFSQAGKPVQLSPYPLPTDADESSASSTVDLTDDAEAPHSS
jgi:hypothetical protein